MISDIAWENVLWLKKSFFKRLEIIGGSSIAVESFRPYFKKEWIESLDPKTARSTFFEEVREWANVLNNTSLTKKFRMNHWKEGEFTQVATGGEEYSKLMWFLFRSHYNLYSISTYKLSIEELAISAYSYCNDNKPLTEDNIEQIEMDINRLLRLSNSFLLTEWFQEMISKAISNNDKEFFNILKNSITTEILAEPSQPAIQWILVILLWFMGGESIEPRRNFLFLLIQNDILPKNMNRNADSFRSELSTLGLTTT